MGNAKNYKKACEIRAEVEKFLVAKDAQFRDCGYGDEKIGRSIGTLVKRMTRAMKSEEREAKLASRIEKAQTRLSKMNEKLAALNGGQKKAVNS